ncbi:MAG: ORF6N domain-containing protein [Bacteroidales bacterium]|nr:ORF6N domain-containing protein [Bacteroidales bacterium]
MVIKDFIHSKIYNFQGHKIMFDFDLSELYDVETRILKQAVRRNIHRFPKEFLIALSKEE